MYAKLHFPAEIDSSGKIRDIVRLITESAAGTAALANLEYITVSKSSLTTGTNSGWTLHSGYTMPSSGTGLSTSDSVYVLEAGCLSDSTKKKKVSIRINMADSQYANNSANVTMCDILDVGEATEYQTNYYTSTNTSYTRGSGLCAVGNNVGPHDIHIFATPRKLILLGTNYNGDTRILMNLESTETGMTTYYNTVPRGHFVLTDASSLTDTSALSYMLETSSASGVCARMSSMAMYINQVFYDLQNNVQTRFLCWMSEGGSWTNYEFSYEDGTNDGLEYGTASSIYTGLASYQRAGAKSNDILFPCSEMYPQYGGNGYRRGQLLNSSGNKIIPLYPMVYNAENIAGGVLNFSDLTNVHLMPRLGVTGDTVTIGSDNYYVVTSKYLYGGSMAIKIE